MGIESKIEIILTLNVKVNYKTVIECGKRCQNIFIGLKKTLFGWFRIKENVTKTMKQV